MGAGGGRQHRVGWRVPLLLAAGTVLLYARSLPYPFVSLDDPQYVTTNAPVYTGLSAANAGWAFTTGHAGNWHPLTWLSLQLDASLYADAGGFRFTNILLHAANAALLYHLLLTLTGAVGRSLVVALLFAAHPMHVEAVVWVTARKDVLSTFFWFLTTLAYVRYARRPGVGTYLPVPALLALGLMAKSMLVTLPCTLVLLDYWPLGRTRWGPPPAAAPGVPASSGRLVLEKVPLFAVVAAAAVVTVVVNVRADTFHQKGISFAARVANAVVNPATYLRQTAWPDDLAIYSPTEAMPPAGAVAAAAIILLTVTAGCVAVGRSRPYLLVGWLWFLGTLVPVGGLIPVGAQLRSDRFTYVPHVGLFVAVVWSVADLAGRRGLGKAAGGLAGVAVAAYAAASWTAIGYWEYPLPFWNHTLAVTGDQNPLARAHLGMTLVAAGRPTDAYPHLKFAARFFTKDAALQREYGLRAAAHGDLGDAVAGLSRAVELDPNDAAARAALPAAQATLSRRITSDPTRARGEYDRVIAAEPGNANAHFFRGLCLMFEGRYGDAAAAFGDALRIIPEHWAALSHLALVRVQLGDAAGGVEPAGRAVAAQPGVAAYRVNLGWVLAAAGRRADAAREYAEATRLDPAWVTTAVQTARTLTAGPDRPPGLLFARSQATAACQATDDRRPDALAALAAVEAADGRPKDAVDAMTRAVAEADRAGSPDLARQLRGDLDRLRTRLQQPGH